MPDPATKTTTRPARRGRTRPAAPPHQLVALHALELPPGPVVDFLRSLPCVGDRIKQIEALRHVEQLARDLGVTEAERLASVRHGIPERTLRRWRTGR